MLIPYERYAGRRRLYPTGKCKKKTIEYSDGSKCELNYVQCRTYLFGFIPLCAKWVDKSHIVWCETKEEVYDCNFTG